MSMNVRTTSPHFNSHVVAAPPRPQPEASSSHAAASLSTAASLQPRSLPASVMSKIICILDKATYAQPLEPVEITFIESVKITHPSFQKLSFFPQEKLYSDNILHGLAHPVYDARLVNKILELFDPTEIGKMSQSLSSTGHKPSRISNNSDFYGYCRGKENFLSFLAKACDFSLVDAYFERKFKIKMAHTPVRDDKFKEFASYLHTAIDTPEQIKKFSLQKFFGIKEALTSPFRDKEYQSLMLALHTYLSALEPAQIKQKAQNFLLHSGKTLERHFRIHKGSYVVLPVSSSLSRVGSDVKNDDL